MHARKHFAALAAAVLVGKAVAAHGHGHAQMHQKKAIEYAHTVTDVVTTVEYVYVTAGHEPTSTAVESFYMDTYNKNTTSTHNTTTHHSTTSTTSTHSSTTTTSTSTSTTSTTSSTTLRPTTSSTTPPPTTLVTSTSASSSSSVADAGGLNVLGISINLGGQSTSSAAASPSPAAVSASTGGGKRGLAYNDPSYLDLFLGSGTECTWSYNWGQTSQGSTGSATFVPMLWGLDSSFTSTWAESAQSEISDNGASCLLSFNEPDNTGQSNLSPSQAAQGHQQYMNPFSSKAQIGSPAITNSQQAGQGVSWLSEWIDACGGQCVFDFCVMHWYSPADTTAFYDSILAVGSACGGKPVWITEFQPSGSNEEVAGFLTEVMQQMDTNSTLNVERYAYFMVEPGVLLDTTTALSNIGELFAYNS